MIEEWLNKRVSVEQTQNSVVDGIDQEFDDDEDEGWLYWRNMVTAKMAYEALCDEKVLRAYRNADVRTYGKALALVKGWTFLGEKRRHGEKARWFARNEADERPWVEAPELSKNDISKDVEIDFLLS